jgi:hypothetical protein
MSNNTLLRKMLSEKDSQIKMPLASTFHKKAQLSMLSKDQLLMIQKSSLQGSNTKHIYDLRMEQMRQE